MRPSHNKRLRRRLSLQGLEERLAPSGNPVLVADIQPGSGSSSPGPFAGMGGNIYFAAFTTTTGNELFRSDGTAAGTSLVADIYPGTGGGFGGANSSNPNNLTTVGNSVFFTANDGVHGVELWKTDGTTAGTVLVNDVQFGANSSNPTMLTVVGNTLYFVATDATHGTELWKSNGTATGTVMVADLNPGSASTTFDWLRSAGGRLFFSRTSGSTQAIDMTDPSGNSITAIANAASDTSSPVVIDTRLFYGFPVPGAIDLNVIDAANANPSPLTVLSISNNGGFGAGSITNMAAVGGNLFFALQSSLIGVEPWISDGTAAGTHLVKDINQDTPTNNPSSNPTGFTDVGGIAYFAATTIADGTELWRSDGTAAGTFEVVDLVLGNGSSSPLALVSLDSKLLFTPQSPAPTTLREYDPATGQITAFPGYAMATSNFSVTIMPSIVYNDVLYMQQGPSNSIGQELYKLEFDPNVPVITGFTPDTGVQGDDVTNAPVIHLSGTATPGIHVQVSDNGSPIGSMVTADASGNWTFTTPALPDGAHAFTANAISLSGLMSANSNTLTITIDTVPPTVTIDQASGQADPTNASPITLTVHFSEPVIGLTAASVNLAASTAGGTLVPTVSGSGADYTVSVTGMTSQGTVVASLPVGIASDAAGNASLASTSTDNSVTFDNVPPTVTINQSPSQSDPTNGPITFDVHFSESVTGFTATGVDLSASTAGGTLVPAVSGSGMDYTVTVTGMSGPGTVVASIPAAVAHDAAGNVSLASTSSDSTVTFDNVPPTVTIDQAGGQADPTNNSPINFTVHFSEPVVGFTAAGVNLASSTVGGTLVRAVSGSGSDYTVTVTGMNGTGTVVASIPANVANDAAGNGNLASASVDNTVIFNNVPPTVTINQGASQPDPTNASPITFAVHFDEPVTGFTAAGVNLSASTAGGMLVPTVSGSGTDYTVTVAGMSSPGTVVASIPAGVADDAAGNGNTASASSDNSVTFDHVGTVQFSTTAYSVIESAGLATVTITRTGGSADALSVQYATTDGIAVAGTDYTATSGTLNWANGDTASKSLTVAILDNGVLETDRAFAVALSNVNEAGALGTPATATIAIRKKAGLSLSSTNYPVNVLDGMATITVHRLGGSTGAVSVQYATSDDTATSIGAVPKYTPTSGTLTWADGDSSDKFVTIPIADVTLSEGNESFKMTLSAPIGNAVLGPQLRATVTISKHNGTTINGSDKKPKSTFTDSDSDQVTVKLTGKIGTLTYYLTDGKGPIAEIDLSGTDSSKSSVSITVKKPKGGTGNGRVQIAEIDGTGVKSLSLGKADLVGAGINLTSFLGALSIGAISNGADITLAGSPPPKPKSLATKITAGVISDGTDIAITGAPLGSLTATSIGIGTITAPSVGSITVKGKTKTKTTPAISGEFKSSLTIAGTGLPAKTPALKSLKVAGTLSGSTILIGGLAGTVGDVGSVSVGSFVSSELFAGYTGPTTGLGTFNLPSTIGSFTVTGKTTAFSHSFVIASNFKNVSLASVDPANSGTKFGFLYHTSMKVLSVNTPSFKFLPTGPAEQDMLPGDFYIKKV